MWVVDNWPGAVFPGYVATRDGYLEVVAEDAKTVNNQQLILLAAEGCAMCLLVVLWVAHVRGGRGRGTVAWWHGRGSGWGACVHAVGGGLG